MVKRFYFSGQSTFSNRGCEAIVRSTVRLLQEQFGDIEVIIPSSDIRRDYAQWPDAKKHGVTFTSAYYPWFTRFWIHAQRLPIPAIKKMGWPFPLPAAIQMAFSGVDAVLSVGGDNYSLDYNLPSLYMGIDAAAMESGTPVILWGASVGPFDKEPDFLPVIKQHLEKMRLITARESVTVEYLRNMGLTNILPVTDPAFTLVPEEVDVASFWPEDQGKGVLGFNVSSLIQRYRPKDEPKGKMVEELAAFIRHAVDEAGLSVLLIPHVIPLDGSTKDNDAFYMKSILELTGSMDNRVRMMDDRLNAAQIKHVISKCRFFMGARTHSTIAALSSSVPTISIAYSIKAKGINQDLFGHTNWVLETPKVSNDTLKESLSALLSNEEDIKSQLAERIPLWQSRAAEGVAKLAEILG